MNADITPYAYGDAMIRTVVKDGFPWFVVKDVCQVLGIKQPGRATEHFPEGEVSKVHLPSPSGEQEYLTVNEPGLYRLIFMSDSPDARYFCEWVYKELLPYISNRITEVHFLSHAQLESITQQVKSLDEITQIYSFRYYLDYFLSSIRARTLNELRTDQLQLIEIILMDMKRFAENIRENILCFMTRLAEYNGEFVSEYDLGIGEYDWTTQKLIRRLENQRFIESNTFSNGQTYYRAIKHF